MTTDARVIELARPEIDGLTCAYRPGDGTAISELANRVFEADGVPWRTDPEEQENWLSAANEHFDPARDTFLVEVDGTLVANADTEWVDTTDGLREFRMGCMVDPAWRRRGIGTWLQRVLERMSPRSPAANPTDRPWPAAWAADSESDRIALLTRFGSSRCATSSRWCGRRWTRSRSRSCRSASSCDR